MWGDDLIDGGAGLDVAAFEGSGGVRVSLETSSVHRTSEGADLLRNIEGLAGLQGDNHLTGNGEDNVLLAWDGNDTMIGGAGRDFMSSRDGHDILRGGAGNDTVEGGTGNDLLRGDSGHDTLDGGAGNDRLYGGVDTARDVFVFTTASESRAGEGRDRIVDFRSGIDDIDLRGIDARSQTDGDDAFVFSADGPAAHAVWTRVSGTNLVLCADVNGDARADFEVTLSAVGSIVVGDVLL